MHILDAAFVVSAADPRGWPAPEGPEIAICGRSNVGKSSLLNVLLGRRALVRVSKTPGRTRLINFFRLKATLSRGGPVDLLLADLPGFGYAKVSKDERATWRPLIQRYLEERSSLRVVVLLCDARRALDHKSDPSQLAEEADLARWLHGLGHAVLPIVTKADKLSKHERKPAADAVARLLGSAPLVFSANDPALRDAGTKELWRRAVLLLSPDGPIAESTP